MSTEPFDPKRDPNKFCTCQTCPRTAAERDIENKRIGFIAGYHKMHIEFVGSVAPHDSAKHAAERYIERIRGGGK